MKVEFEISQRLFNDFSFMAEMAGVPLAKCLEDYFEDYPELIGDRCQMFERLLEYADEEKSLAIIDRALKADPVNHPEELARAVLQIFLSGAHVSRILFQAVNAEPFELPEDLNEMCLWTKACLDRIGVEPSWRDAEKLVFEYGLGKIDREEFDLLCHASLILSGKLQITPPPSRMEAENRDGDDDREGDEWKDND